MGTEDNVAEVLKELVEENQTRKILEVLNDCKNLDEAKQKIKEMLNKN